MKTISATVCFTRLLLAQCFIDSFIGQILHGVTAAVFELFHQFSLVQKGGCCVFHGGGILGYYAVRWRSVTPKIKQEFFR